MVLTFNLASQSESLVDVTFQPMCSCSITELFRDPSW